MARFQNGGRIKRQVHIDDHSLNILLVLLCGLLIMLLITGAYFIALAGSDPILGGEDSPAGNMGEYPFRQEISVTAPEFADEDQAPIPQKTETREGIGSEAALLLDMTTGKIVASRLSEREIYPASMVKVMTLIVVIENLTTAEAMDERLTISQEVAEKMYGEGASGFGFQVGEVLTVRDLLHALILNSDGIAAMTLAEYIADSESAFVEMMNQKADELGMVKTQFQNCTGLPHDYMISTCKDMAIMMSYAMRNSFCAEILTAKSHKLAADFREGGPYTLWHATLVQKFDRLKPQLTSTVVKGAKSGWTGDDSGYCLVTYAEGSNGHKYVLVTAKAETSEGSIADMAYILNEYAK